MNFRFLLAVSLIFCCCILSGVSFGQTKQDSLIKEASFLVLRNKVDSAQIVLNQANDLGALESDEGKLIIKIAKNQKLSTTEYCAYFREVLKHHDLNYFDLYRTYKRLIKEPKSKKIDLKYVEILSLVCSRIRNDGNIDLGNKVQKDLDNYVGKFRGTEKDVQKAKVIASFNNLVLLGIQNKWEEGLRKSESLLNSSLELKDTNLIISTKYYQCEFLLIKGDLEKFIRISRECYELDRNRGVKSDFYTDNLIHLCDALIYQEGNTQEVLNLLGEMYDQPEERVHSYSLYAKLLSFASDDKSTTEKIVFDQFEVSNIREFCNKIFQESRDYITPNEYYYVLLEGARALSEYGENELALEAMNKAIYVSRSIYSGELANALANHKTEEIRLESEVKLQANEMKVANEKFQSKIYISAAIVVFVFLCIAVIALWKQRSQSRLLKLRNDEISQKNEILQKQDAEKTLLVKEIHHRVKNNFQIVSSLLELQTKGIEDERALELALEGQRRVRSMAIIHQKLYQKDEMLINLSEYMEELVMEIYSTYSPKSVAIDIQIDSRIVFDIETSIPLGLIINELVTNAFKYGFSLDRENKLRVEVRKGSEFYTLVVTDNGPGMDESIDVDKTKSVGLHLVKRLSKQLRGELSYTTENGAKFTLKFKDTEMRSVSE